MNSRLLTVAVAAVVVHFFAGLLVYGIALGGFMEANMNPEVMVTPPDFVWMGASTSLGALLLVVVLTRWGAIASWKDGARTGALVGFFVQGGIATGLYAATTLYSGGLVVVAVDTIAGVVMFAITGAVVGFMLGRGNVADA